MLAADSGSGLPLWNLFWTMLLFFALALVFWLLIAALRVVFGRDDLSTGAKVAWTAFIFVLPLVGSVACLVTRPREPGGADQYAASRDVWRLESVQQQTYVPNFH